jgi:hypothetical protein
VYDMDNPEGNVKYHNQNIRKGNEKSHRINNQFLGAMINKHRIVNYGIKK